MAFRFRYTRKFPIIPGILYLNVNARSVSLTTKIGPVSHTRSTSGRRTTSIALPGRGSLRSVSTAAGRHRQSDEARREATRADLQGRIDARRASIRRMREERDR